MASKKRFPRIAIAVLVLLFYLSSPATADDGSYAQGISTWWSGVKTRIENMFGYGQPEKSPAATPAPGGEAATDASAAASAPKPAVKAPEHLPAAEANRTIRPRQLLDIPSVQVQPALTIAHHEARIDVSSVPEFKPRPKKAVPALAALAPVVPVKARAGYSPGEKPSPAGPLAFKRTTVLDPIQAVHFDPVAGLTADTLSLLNGLFAWLLSRDDEALGIFRDLAVNPKTDKAIRQKAMSFLAWALSDTGNQALASLAFWRALDISPATGTDGYTDAALASLSAVAHITGVAKTAGNTVSLERLLQRPKLALEDRAFLLLLSAERAYDRKAFAVARRFARDVPQASSWSEQARYLAAISLIAEQDDNANLRTAGRELTALFRTVETPEVFDATAVTLGRIHFILGNYDASHQYLQQVSREANVFIEAAVDNGWALLRSGNGNNAVGNMFTLHTPYFEGAYMPESYFLQSLGYQGICQFGDALTAVKQYKMRYHDSYSKLIAFNNSGKTNEQAYYDDLVAYLAHHDSKLSGIVLRELGRHPEFLRRQKDLNKLSHEQAALTKLFPKSQQAVEGWLAAEIAGLRQDYKHDMNRFLKSRALELEDELKFLTANVSLLEYEIFAGAGQNLSLQGAQNFAVDDKAAPSHTFGQGKEYWPYEDEIWEDELNNFRSKMVNGCAKARKPAAGGDGASNDSSS